MPELTVRNCLKLGAIGFWLAWGWRMESAAASTLYAIFTAMMP